MTNTAAEYSERQQLLPSIASYEEDCEDSSSSSGGDGGEEEIMAQSSRFLGPIVAILAIPILWLAFTGCVVVPPGEIAVVVTLVRDNSMCMLESARILHLH